MDVLKLISVFCMERQRPCAICKLRGKAGMSSLSTSSFMCSSWECVMSSRFKGVPAHAVGVIWINIWFPIELIIAAGVKKNQDCILKTVSTRISKM